MLIREATVDDAAGIARVHVDTWRATYAGIVPAEHLAALSAEAGAQRWRSNLAAAEPGRFTYVADDAGQVVGFASGGPERSGDPEYRGEVYALYVLPAWQRRGVGRQLLGACGRRLLAQGVVSLLIWVLADNPSRDFYARLGGLPLREQEIEIGGACLREVAYGWPDVRSLAGAHGHQGAER
jgi:GNAT superfamily N-acetyltransferase